MTSEFDVVNLDSEHDSTNVPAREHLVHLLDVPAEQADASSSSASTLITMFDYQYFPPRRKIRWVLLFMVCASGALVTIKLVKPTYHGQSLSGSLSYFSRTVSPVSTATSSPQTLHRQNVVKQMMKFAWDKYVKYAWGFNELRPVSRTGYAGGAPYGGDKLGLTIVDSLDTLLLMNLTDEFAAGMEWVQDQYSMLDTKSMFSVFETNIRYLGGFLSAHALSGNRVFLEKAVQVGNVLLHAFNSPTGLPYSLYDYSRRRGSLYSWTYENCVFLADTGTLHMEFGYLSEMTGNRSYIDAVTRVRKLLKNSRNAKGLYPNHVDFQNTTGAACKDYSVSVGAFGDSFYEYLLKYWLLSGKTDHEAKMMFDKAIVSLEKQLLKTSKAGYTYFAKLEPRGQIVDSMEHLACFIGGLYALAADASTDTPRFRKLAEDLTKTCRVTYNRTKTGLGPESFVMDENGVPVSHPGSRQYILRPEVVESYYYLWKMTGDQKYRDWAWDAVLGIEKYCKKADGYTGIPDTDDTSTAQTDDVQQSFFMAETLKYLYLIFLDEEPLPSHSWVFTTEAHPLPVIGSEPYQAAFMAWRGYPHASAQLSMSSTTKVSSIVPDLDSSSAAAGRPLISAVLVSLLMFYFL